MSSITSVIALGALVQASEGEGLTLHEIVSALPTDPAAIFTIVLFLSCTALVIWAGGKPRGKGGRPA